MKPSSKISPLWLVVFTLFALVSCNNPIERSGIIIDRETFKPLQNVSIDIYMKTQKRDSLKEKVFTDSNGHFFIREKRNKDQLFLVQKDGYISYTNSLSIGNDTIKLEKE